MKYILFGAGKYGKDALNLLGKEKVDFFIDNDQAKSGMEIDGVKVYHVNGKKNELRDKKIVISVSERYKEQVTEQLEAENIRSYISLDEIKLAVIKERMKRQGNNLDTYKRAIGWIYRNTVKHKGIINHTGLKKPYPEVTGYYIPTLMRWGHRDLAVSYAKWLCGIQKEDGSWYDTRDVSPYVFDSAQILKGLLSVRDIYPEADGSIKRGFEWILSNMEESGRLTTPDIREWGRGKECSELIHLYCLSPLIEAGKLFGIKRYAACAEKILHYYKNNHRKEIMNFSLLSHFYAYVMEALVDLGELEMAEEAMADIAKLQNEEGAVPAYKDVHWVCSTGLFQLAVVWYRIGCIENGNRAFAYACRLQNPSGGWYGSYLTEYVEGEENDYFPTGEISWAVKYFLDALYYKNLAEFNFCAASFLPAIDKEDGRYQTVKNEILNAGGEEKVLKICDVGCGKGRYLNNLLTDASQNSYYGVDLSESVLKYVTDQRIEKKQGSLTKIPYPDNFFDVVYTCEALEHAVDIKSAVKEMARVTRPGGKMIVVDKNKEALGKLVISDWEVWFDLKELEELMKELCSETDTMPDIPYEGKSDDNLFAVWTGKVR